MSPSTPSSLRPTGDNCGHTDPIIQMRSPVPTRGRTEPSWRSSQHDDPGRVATVVTGCRGAHGADNAQPAASKRPPPRVILVVERREALEALEVVGDAVDAVGALVAAVAAQARQLDQVTRQLADVSKVLDRQIKRDRQVRNSLHAAGIKVI